MERSVAYSHFKPKSACIISSKSKEDLRALYIASGIKLLRANLITFASDLLKKWNEDWISHFKTLAASG